MVTRPVRSRLQIELWIQRTCSPPKVAVSIGFFPARPYADIGDARNRSPFGPEMSNDNCSKLVSENAGSPEISNGIPTTTPFGNQPNFLRILAASGGPGRSRTDTPRLPQATTAVTARGVRAKINTAARTAPIP